MAHYSLLNISCFLGNNVHTHITKVSSVDVKKMSILDIGPILLVSVGRPRNIPTAKTEIRGMSFFKFLTPLHSAVGHSTVIRNGESGSEKITKLRIMFNVLFPLVYYFVKPYPIYVITYLNLFRPKYVRFLHHIPI